MMIKCAYCDDYSVTLAPDFDPESMFGKLVEGDLKAHVHDKHPGEWHDLNRPLTLIEPHP